MISKSLIVRRIIVQLTAQLANLAGASRTMHADASDEQNKPEDKYDTRALETSYLASAQARQATETEQALVTYQNLALRTFDAATPIDLTALVEIDDSGERVFYFVGPSGGGLDVSSNGVEALVITAESPLGKKLIGRKTGEVVRLDGRGAAQELRIVTVE